MQKKDLRQVINEVNHNLNDMDNFYKANCVNWKGKILNSNELYTEKISEILFNNINKFNTIKNVTRKGSYYVQKHRFIKIDSRSNRMEEFFAKRLVGLQLNGIGKIIDYQIPLKSTRNNIGVGTIDLISLNIEKKTLFLIELKYENNEDTLLRATLESYTYFKTIDKSKLIRDYFNIIDKTINGVINVNDIKVLPAVLVTPGCKAYDELMDIDNRLNFQKLAKKINMNFFIVDIKTNEIII